MRKPAILLLLVLSILVLRAAVLRRSVEEKIALGAALFFDPILSKDSTVSCASCHRPDHAFADTVALSLGVGQKKGKRNAPSAMNLLLGRSFFWDGRAATLEDQALA